MRVLHAKGSCTWWAARHSPPLHPPTQPPTPLTRPSPPPTQTFREPLYLLDRPVRQEDARSEEERRYPELFRARLEREGWAVARTPSTVPIPGVNVPAAGGDHRAL